MGSTAGATPAGAALLSAFLALVALQFVVNHTLAVPSAAVNFAKKGKHMKRAKVMFASVLDTIHGLGVSGLASCLLAKGSLSLNKALKPTSAPSAWPGLNRALANRGKSGVCLKS